MKIVETSPITAEEAKKMVRDKFPNGATESEIMAYIKSAPRLEDYFMLEGARILVGQAAAEA